MRNQCHTLAMIKSGHKPQMTDKVRLSTRIPKHFQELYGKGSINTTLRYFWLDKLLYDARVFDCDGVKHFWVHCFLKHQETKADLKDRDGSHFVEEMICLNLFPTLLADYKMNKRYHRVQVLKNSKRRLKYTGIDVPGAADYAFKRAIEMGWSSADVTDRLFDQAAQMNGYQAPYSDIEKQTKNSALIETFRCLFIEHLIDAEISSEYHSYRQTA